MYYVSRSSWAVDAVERSVAAAVAVLVVVDETAAAAGENDKLAWASSSRN